MKKRLITFFCAVCMVMLLSACSPDESGTITSATGNSAVFRTYDVQEYLAFLEDFDENRYEIIDISTSMKSFSDHCSSGEFYVVTYKIK